MFDDLNKDPGEEGLTKAARIFYVLAVLGAIVFSIRVLMLIAGSPQSIADFFVAPISATLSYFTARGIEERRTWAKWIGYVQGALSLLNFPIGTIIGLFVLVYIYRADRAGLFGSKSIGTPATA